MKVLVACEESQVVCMAFRNKGHEAYSCDLQECSGGYPQFHINNDVLDILNGNTIFSTQDGTWRYVDKWDLIIAHPPCTYLTNGGAVRMFRNEKKLYEGYGEFQMVNVERVKKMIVARDFFLMMLNANADKVAIENPVPMGFCMLPKETQVIQPYEFGDPYSKKTYLWLKGLKPLEPTNVLTEYQPLINGGGGRLDRENYKGKKFAAGSVKRSKTFPGIATAMSEQWG